MDKIKFDNMIDWRWATLALLSLALILIGIIEPIAIEDPQTYKRISAFGFLLLTICIGRLFWFKNALRWNKKGMHIKINSFIGTNLRFSEIKSVNFQDSELIITPFGGRKTLNFDLSNIESNDRNLLKDILKERIPDKFQS